MENFLREGVDLSSLGIYRGRTIAGDAHFFDDATTPTIIRNYLASTKDYDKLTGMKLLLAMLSKGSDIPEFFPDVVKNVVVRNIEVKKMVYIYLVHYADYDDACREIALLSINSFQKDLAGTNQLIRGLALRVMTSVRVADIIQIQLLAVRKCSTDSSPYVRKCAANALPKIFSLDKDQLGNLKQLLGKLLRDSSTMVLGSAVAAFNEICPTSYDIIHRSYRKLCHLLADMDEWSQVSVLEVMTRYTRDQFTDPAPGTEKASRLQAQHRSTAAVAGRSSRFVKRRVVKKAFYSDEEDESEEETVEVEDGRTPLHPTTPSTASVEAALNASASSINARAGADDGDVNLDADHQLILKSSLPLLKSRNSGVVLNVALLHYHCGSRGNAVSARTGKALVRILRNRREVQYVVLQTIKTIARASPEMFRPYLSDFFVTSSDPLFNRTLKLEILTSLCHKENTTTILKELQIYIKDNSPKFVCTVAACIGRVCDADPTVVSTCMTGLMHLLLCTKSPVVTAQVVITLRQLLQQSKDSPNSSMILHQLVKLLIIEGGIEEPSARTSIVWLVGEFNHILSKVAPDILRLLATSFSTESTECKMQIMNLAIKMALLYPDREDVQSLMMYVLEMSRYDMDMDLRDRSRFMTALSGLASFNESAENDAQNGSDVNAEGGVSQVERNDAALVELSEHASGIMLAPKLPPVTLLGAVDIDGELKFTMGSLSSIVGHHVAGYEQLPPWPTVQPDPTVRDAHRAAPDEAENASGGMRGMAGMPGHGTSAIRGDADRTNRRDRADSSSSSSRSSSRGSRSDSDASGSTRSSSGSSASSRSTCSVESHSESDSASQSSSDARGGRRRRRRDRNGGSRPSERRRQGRRRKSGSESASSAGYTRSSGSGSSSGSENESHRDSGSATPPVVTSSSRANTSTANVSRPISMSIRRAAPSTAALGMFNTSVSAPGSGAMGGGVVDDLTGSLASAQLSTSKSFQLDANSNPTSSKQGNDGDSGNANDDGDNVLVEMEAMEQQEAAAAASKAEAGFDDSLFLSQGLGPRPAPASGQGLGIGQSTKVDNILASFDKDSSQESMATTQSLRAPAAGTSSASLAVDSQPQSQQQQQQQQQHPSFIDAASFDLQGLSDAARTMLCEPHLAEPTVLLRPELGGGLGVSFALRHSVRAVAFVGALAAFLIVRNKNDHPVRRVRINFPADVRKTAVPEIPLLAPGQQVVVPLEVVLSKVAGKQIKVDVRCDKGAYAGLLTVHEWDTMQPLTMTPSEFERARDRLAGGFMEISKKYSFSSIGINVSQFNDANSEVLNHSGEEALLLQLQRTLNVFVVQGAGVGELLLAGSVRKGLTVEEKVLLTVTLQDSGAKAVVGETATASAAAGAGQEEDREGATQEASFILRLNCEDAVMCSTLSEQLKKCLLRRSTAPGMESVL